MRTLRLFIALSILAIITACERDLYQTCSPDNLEPDPPGQWYLGDFHVHASGASNDTDGNSSPQAIQQMARQRGLHFLVLTDHSNSTGSDVDTTYEDPVLFNKGSEFPYWDLAGQLSITGEFLMIDGCEISPRSDGDVLPTGHIGCIPQNLNTFDQSGAFTDRPMGAVSGASAIAQSNSRGGFSIVNHAYSIAAWIAYDWTSYDYHALEVWNGTIGYDFWDKQARRAWQCDLLSGKPTVAVGGSDAHRVATPPPGVLLDPAIGYPTTAVFATDLSWNAIMEGLRAGKTAIFEGESRLYIDTYNAEGCRDEGNAVRIVRLRGRVDSTMDSLQVLLTRATACTDTRPSHLEAPQIAEDTLLIQNIIGGADFDLRIPINGEKGVYSAILVGDSEGHYGALSRAVVID